MSKVIFKDEAQQALFDKQGFVVAPFLEEHEVAALNALFDSLHPNLQQNAGFVSGSYSPDAAYKQKASEEIVKIFSKHYERLFVNYQPFGAAFLYKMPNPNSQLGIHQDWTIVDEEQYIALNCWVPLTDVDATNGALAMVPGTHYDKIKSIRCPTLPFFFANNDDVMEKAAVPVYVKAGYVVVLDQSIVHYSPPNRSNKIRKAITAGVKSKGVDMTFHYRDHAVENAPIERFRMPENFLISFDNFLQDIVQRPKYGVPLGTVDFEQKILERNEVIALTKRLTREAGFESSGLDNIAEVAAPAATADSGSVYANTAAPKTEEAPSLWKRLRKLAGV